MNSVFLGVLLVLVVVVPAVATVIYKIVVTRVKWEVLPGFPSVKWRAAGTAVVDPARLSAAFSQSIIELGRHSKWTEVDVYAACGNLTLTVMPVDSWVDMYGRTIAGSGDATMTGVTVGLKLEALCHELAHMLEWHTDSYTDNAHTKWAERGLWNAVDAYQAWLAASEPKNAS